MIGSKAKKVQLFEQLAARGVPATFLERVRTPMGLSIGARTHEEIAVAVAAELISFRRLGGVPGDAARGEGARRGPDAPRDPACSPR
jgi:xanthine/CO dehydrogenase XdhC/CoxF family maturation factor